MSTILSVLNAIEQGEPNAAEQLLPLVYTELRELAALKLARESPGSTLQPTALVHKPYIRVVKDEQGRSWDSRRHFFAASADGSRIVSAGLDATVRVWDATPLPASHLRLREAHTQQKETELKTILDRIGPRDSAQETNSLSPKAPWNLGAASVARTIESDPTNLTFRQQHILALLKGENGAEVRHACEDLLRNFGSTIDPGRASRVAWYCLLGP